MTLRVSKLLFTVTNFPLNVSDAKCYEKIREKMSYVNEFINRFIAIDTPAIFSPVLPLNFIHKLGQLRDNCHVIPHYVVSKLFTLKIFIVNVIHSFLQLTCRLKPKPVDRFTLPTLKPNIFTLN